MTRIIGLNFHFWALKAFRIACGHKNGIWAEMLIDSLGSGGRHGSSRSILSNAFIRRAAQFHQKIVKWQRFIGPDES